MYLEKSYFEINMLQYYDTVYDPFPELKKPERPKVRKKKSSKIF